MRPSRIAFALLLLAPIALAQDDPKPESPYVKLLKKAPEGRMGQIVDIIGQRGTADDLAYLYGRSTTDGPDAFPPAIRSKALEVLADAALTRNLKPQVDPGALKGLIRSKDAKDAQASIRLAGLWKAEAAVADLIEIAGSKTTPRATRLAAFDALAAIGGDRARLGIEALSAADRPAGVRALAVSALARLDVDRAAPLAVVALSGDLAADDVTSLIAAFLDRRGGADKLASALAEKPPSVDAARLALRATYALGRADESLIGVLSKAAGLDAEAKLPTKGQMDALIAEVNAKGDPARGERIFRRAELNCMKCHAIAGAAGGVGPELTAVGLSSPVDYLVNSILIPDQAIKEEFQTRTVLTDDGRIVQGIVVEEDDKRIVLKEATGETRTIAAGSVEDSKKGGSLMPKGLANLLTHAEFVDLVRFLYELGKPGPYAIRATPTVQRWRVLKDAAPDDLGDVLQAEPDRWAPAYATASGELPDTDPMAIRGGEPVAYLQGEIAVSAPGAVTFRLNSAKGIAAWVDDKPLPEGDAPTAEVDEGKHKLTLRLDTRARGSLPIRVEVVKPEGSSAEFSVVGGR